ncbi:MAG: gliding motility-associated C-terminal domain-containing protein [Flavobacteriales bacterium]|jgi:gliding motility-associated-like protein
MKKFLLFGLFTWMMCATSVAQERTQEHYYTAPFNARYSPKMTEEELYSKPFLQKMSKQDWVRFTKDPRFNADRVAQLKTEWKRESQQARKQMRTSQTSGESNCYWIEPTSEYTHPNPIQWPGSPGNSTDNFSAPINLGWNFNFFGTNYNQIVITTKGTIVLGNTGYIDFTPSAFPDPLGTETNQQYNHIAGFWTDFDFGASGEIYYNLTPEALYINYIDVGYWPNFSDKTNSFQMIITPDGSNVIGGGNNVQFVYLDMQWVNSQISGATGGCQANNNFAVVGADRSSGTQHYAFGRFNLCNSTAWDGPYGVQPNNQDGVDWLDGRVIEFNTGVTNFVANQPPVVVGEACDTITMCVGESFDFNLAFTSPESNQSTSIAFTQSSTGFSATSTTGNAAVLNNATFTASASNIGSNTVTITATDNGSPAASTTVTYTFLVEDVEAPPIEITGVLNICAGQVTTLTATDGFDSYSWSNGASGTSADVSQPGNITVVGSFGFCSSVATAFIDVTPYFIPQLEGGNIPIEICPGIDTVICVLGDYASYQWQISPGYDGEFVPGSPLDEACAQVTGNVNGNYEILVTDDAGCQGFNIKLVTTSPSTPCPTNDDNNGIRCDGLQELDFCGYSVPPEDNLVIYALSTNQNGWQGSFINIYVYPADGGPVEEYFLTSFGALTLYDDIMIGAGDSVSIEYFANGNNFQGNSLWVINCGQSSPTIIPAPLTTGLVWSGASSCFATDLEGTWSVDGPGGWAFSDPSQMTTVWTPTQYGVYELCFSNANCAFDYCYNIEYAQAPSINITPGLPVALCDAETAEQSVVVNDPSGNGTISWNGPGVTPSADGLSAVMGPYTNYTNASVTASITNACGTYSDSFNVSYQPDVPEPSLQDLPLCQNGSVTLDPIPANLDNPELQYDWNPGNNSGSTLNVTTPGVYTVIVSNDCDESNPVSANVSGVVAATITSAPAASILECDDDQVTLTVQYADATNYSASWQGPVDSQNATVVADQDGEYCYTVTDNFGCNSASTACINVNISAAPNTTSGSSDLLALCPRECKNLEVISDAEDASVTWTTSCTGFSINTSGAALDYCADNVPQSCLGEVVVLTANITNGCGTAQASWQIQSNACEVLIPNVFTPNGAQGNDTFEIGGLEKYNGAELTIFNRWGDKVYESTNYRNDWRANDLSEGTYWYILKLPYGIKTEYKGNVQILR